MVKKIVIKIKNLNTYKIMTAEIQTEIMKDSIDFFKQNVLTNSRGDIIITSGGSNTYGTEDTFMGTYIHSKTFNVGIVNTSLKRDEWYLLKEPVTIKFKN